MRTDRHLHLIPLLAAIALVAGCRNGSTVVDTGAGAGKVPSEQIALVEREYVNFAWGYQHQGIMITGEGNIVGYQWERTDRPWTQPEGSTITGALLDEKYGHNRTHLGTVSADTLALIRELIPAASRGTLSEREQGGNDMGQTGSTAFLLDTRTGLYTIVPLRSEGDFRWHNVAGEARRLADIIDAIAERVR